MSLLTESVTNRLSCFLLLLYLLYLICCCIQSRSYYGHTHPSPTFMDGQLCVSHTDYSRKEEWVKLLLYPFWQSFLDTNSSYPVKPPGHFQWNLCLLTSHVSFVHIFIHQYSADLYQANTTINHWARYLGRLWRWISDDLCLWRAYQISPLSSYWFPRRHRKAEGSQQYSFTSVSQRVS